MFRPRVLAGGAVLLLLTITAWRLIESSSSPEIPFETKNKPPPPAPLCPWRDPDADLKLFFPETTRCELETRVLSGLRLELAGRLGRTPTGDENALRVHRIYRDHDPIGSILTRRVKGAFGAIELVLAVNADGQTRGLRLQRLREPESVAGTLQNPDWLHSFTGKRADSPFKLGLDIPDVTGESRGSAEAIAEGVRSLLILLAASDQSGLQSRGVPSHH
jgi:hypothetical protein